MVIFQTVPIARSRLSVLTALAAQNDAAASGQPKHRTGDMRCSPAEPAALPAQPEDGTMRARGAPTHRSAALTARPKIYRLGADGSVLRCAYGSLVVSQYSQTTGPQ